MAACHGERLIISTQPSAAAARLFAQTKPVNEFVSDDKAVVEELEPTGFHVSFSLSANINCP